MPPMPPRPFSAPAAGSTSFGASTNPAPAAPAAMPAAFELCVAACTAIMIGDIAMLAGYIAI